MTLCWVYIDPPRDGAWNMAADEVLLENSARQGVASLRFYRWSEPTLSLGYFQRYAERTKHAPSVGLPAVRRLSGGGALVHDRELTYSLHLPASHPLARTTSELFRAVHLALIDALGQFGVTARLFGDLDGANLAGLVDPDAFLCFERRNIADVVVTARAIDAAAFSRLLKNGTGSRPDAQHAGDFEPSERACPIFQQPPGPAKVAGSAQRRRRGAVLQHGSVLLETSPSAPNLPGITQLTGTTIPVGELREAWQARIEAALELRGRPQEPGAGEFAAAVATRAVRYISDEWLNRR